MNVPDGYITFGWWRGDGTINGVWESVVHLARADDPNIEKRPELVCGRPVGKGRRERDINIDPHYLGDRTCCQRCFKRAAADLAKPCQVKHLSTDG